MLEKESLIIQVLEISHSCRNKNWKALRMSN